MTLRVTDQTGTIRWTNTTGNRLESGVGVPVGALMGVTAAAIEDSTTGILLIDGSFILDKDNSNLALGASVNMLASGEISSAAGAVTGGAVVLEAAGSSVGSVHVRLCPGAGQ